MNYQEDNDSVWRNAMNKCYQLVSPKDCDELLGDEVAAFFSTLNIEKTDLNAVKSLLNTLDIVAWHRHTGNTHLFSNIPAKLRHHIKAELPTQAWAKFYCILGNFDLIKTDGLGDDKFRSVHLCEAPGAFVTSLNHFIQNNFRTGFKWDWLGTTLNPYYEGNELGKMIPDDRFIINTLDKWFFGTDFTGDIMDRGNLNDLKNKLHDSAVHLVTADGSIDCSDEPGEQENIVFPIFLWEVITALNILSAGGSFVIKMFTMFEKRTVTLMYLLTSVFESVHLFKPGPSKPGNSEVYVVAQNFDPQCCHNLQLFTDLQNSAFQDDPQSIENLVDFSKVSKLFLSSIREFVEESSSFQKAAINENRRTFQSLTASDENELGKTKAYFAKRFVKDLNIWKIETYVSPMFKMMMMHGQFKNHKHNLVHKKGSYEQRQHNQQNKRFKSSVDGEESPSPSPTIDWYDGVDILHVETLLSFEPIVGRQCDKLRSSLFCSPSLLQTFQQSEIVFSESCEVKNTLTKLVDSFGAVLGEANVDVISGNDEFVEHVCNCLGHTKTENNADVIVLDLQELTVDLHCKKKQLQNVLDFLAKLKEPRNVCIHFHGLLLSSFWVGLVYLFSSLYKNVVYHCPMNPTSCLYMVFTDFKRSSGEKVTKLQNYLEQCLQRFDSLSNDMDVLHILPIHQLMQSDFRQYITNCNNLFVQTFL